jgi:hypothetical protein
MISKVQNVHSSSAYRGAPYLHTYAETCADHRASLSVKQPQLMPRNLSNTRANYNIHHMLNLRHDMNT